MLVTMSQKELDWIPVLQQLYDKRLTQSRAAKLLNISESYSDFGPTLAARSFWNAIASRNLRDRSERSRRLFMVEWRNGNQF